MAVVSTNLTLTFSGVTGITEDTISAEEEEALNNAVASIEAPPIRGHLHHLHLRRGRRRRRGGAGEAVEGART